MNTMIRSMLTASALRSSMLAGSAVAGFIVALALPSAALDEKSAVPPLASATFGWQSNVSDWQEPPAGSGHGPIKPDPDHPYTSNAEAARTGKPPTKRIGNYKDPVLKPWAAAQMKASNDEALSNEMKIPFAAQARCYPGGVPGQLLFPFEPMYIIQTPKIVYMMWQRDQWVRRIFLTDKHSETVKPSWFGESIGRYENGDTLVIDTIGLQTKNAYVDNFRTPFTEKLHVVERLTLDAGGKFLTGIVTVTDADTFNAPLTMKQRWFKAEQTMLETICPENNKDYFNQGLFALPQAKKPDF
jgi:hypothetical protein